MNAGIGALSVARGWMLRIGRISLIMRGTAYAVEGGSGRL